MPHFSSGLGLIINKKKLHEGDLQLTIFTQNLGKITCLAKGVRSIKSRRLGHLEIGNVIKFNLYQKGPFFWLSESESVSPFLKQPKKLSQYNLLFFLYEVANSIIPAEEILPDIYLNLSNATQALAQDNYPDFIREEINFIRNLGFGLNPQINLYFDQKDYQQAQKAIKNYFESILEKPLKTPKLFI